MKLWLNILIVVCVVLTASSVKAKDRPTLPNNQNNVEDERPFVLGSAQEIQVLEKRTTRASLDGDAEKLGFNTDDLTNYLRLKVKNNFFNMEIKDWSDLSDYQRQQIGVIHCRVWTVSADFTISYYIQLTIGDAFHRHISEIEILGLESKDNIHDKVRKLIGDMVEQLAIKFYKVRGEL